MASSNYGFSHIFKCNVTEVTQELSSDPIFQIEVKAALIVMERCGDEEDDMFADEGTFHAHLTHEHTIEELISDSKAVILKILNYVHVPIKQGIVENIASYAVCLAMAKKRSRMMVEIEAIVDRWPSPVHYDEDDEDVMMEEEKMENVGKVVIKNSGTNCPICLEEFTVGSEEAACMPCLHIFHCQCILTWLKKDKRCPYCRSNLSASIEGLEIREKA